MEKEYPDQISSVPMLLKYNVSFIVNLNGFYWIVLENRQSFLTDGVNVYDTTNYRKIDRVFSLGDRLCAVYTDFKEMGVVDLNNKETIFTDSKATDIFRVDDETLNVKFSGRNTLFSIKENKFLYCETDYVYEEALGNELFVFAENDDEKDFKEKKRFIIDSSGNIVMNDIVGRVLMMGDNLVVSKEDGLQVRINCRSKSYSEVFIENTRFLTEPLYYNNKIIIIVKGSVRFYSSELKLLKECPIEGLDSIIYANIGKDGLLNIRYKLNDENGTEKALLLNCDNDKSLNHDSIIQYPVFPHIPKTFIGIDNKQDDFDGNLKQYHFYDINFNEKCSVNGNEKKDIENEYLFIIKSNKRNYFVNSLFGVVKPCEYNNVIFETEAVCGFAGYSIYDDDGNEVGYDYDIVDMNLDVKVRGVLNENPDIVINISKIEMVNDWVAVVLEYRGEESIFETILFDPNGKRAYNDVVLGRKVFSIGYTMMFEKTGGGSLFLNTKTGELRPLTITATPYQFCPEYADFGDVGLLSQLLGDTNLIKCAKNKQKINLLPVVGSAE